MSEYEELMAIHSPLVNAIQGIPHYKLGEVSAIHGYSEGAEHALDTAWARGYRRVVAVRANGREELANLIDVETHVDWFSGSAGELADALIAAGYRKVK